MIYYDGECGLCHGTVRFVAAVDGERGNFRFAPLHGTTFRQRVPPGEAEGLPDTVVVQRPDGRLLLRSAATVYILRRLGGSCRVLAGLLWLVPAPLRDAGYDVVARHRARMFRRPDASCPVLPAGLRSRLDP